MAREDAKLRCLFKVRREGRLVRLMVSCGEEQNLFVRLDAEGLERDGDGNVFVDGVVAQVDLALFRGDVRFRLETAVRRAVVLRARGSARKFGLGRRDGTASRVARIPLHSALGTNLSSAGSAQGEALSGSLKRAGENEMTLRANRDYGLRHDEGARTRYKTPGRHP